MGVGTVRARGMPIVLSSGKISKLPMKSICRPNEVNVVQPRWVPWAHGVSSVLSANMASSSQSTFAEMEPWERAPALTSQEKKAALSRGLLELSGHSRCPSLAYFAGSVDFGAAGFAAPLVRLGSTGFEPVDPGAATPDCALYRSTTPFVISTPSPATRI